MPDPSLTDVARENAPALLPAAWLMFIIVAIRAVFYHLSGKYLSTLKTKTGAPLSHQLIDKIQEEAFAILGSAVLISSSLYVLNISNHDGACGLLSAVGCFTGWPAEGVARHALVTLYYCLETGWYAHFFLKDMLGMGLKDNLQMNIHHLSTLVLLLISFLTNLHRIGIVVVSSLNLSNPFLHVAKVLHYLETGKSAHIAFALFALVFTLTRIVAFPFIVLRGTMLQSIDAHPAFMDTASHLTVYLVANVLLGTLMVLQLVWWRAVIRVLRQALSGNNEGFTKAGKQADFATTTKGAEEKNKAQ